MPAVARLIFDAATSGFDRARARVEKGIEDLNKSAGRFGGSVEKSAASWGKSLIAVTALVGLLKQAAAAAEEVRAAREKGAEDRGTRRLQASAALAAQGFSAAEQSQAIAAAEGAVDQDAAFRELSAATARDRGNIGGLSARALAAGTGLFTAEEIKQARESGRALDVSARLGGISAEAQAEFSVRQELASQRVRGELGRGSQADDRITSAAVQRQIADSVALTFISQIPLLGDLIAKPIARAVTSSRQPRVNGQE